MIKKPDKQIVNVTDIYLLLIYKVVYQVQLIHTMVTVIVNVRCSGTGNWNVLPTVAHILPNYH